MKTEIVEYKTKNGIGKFGHWTILDYNVPYADLFMFEFNIRINGEVFTSFDQPNFKEKFNNAMFWLRLSK